MSYYEFANDWVGVAAVVTALVVFALVLWLVQRLVPPIDMKFEFRPRRKRRARRAGRSIRPTRLLAAWSPAPASPLTDDDADWQAMDRVIATRADRLQTISALQGRAGQRVEAAQYALDRLLADCAAVMLTPEAAEDMQRRRAALSDVPAPASTPAPAPGSLAA